MRRGATPRSVFPYITLRAVQANGITVAVPTMSVAAASTPPSPAPKDGSRALPPPEGAPAADRPAAAASAPEGEKKISKVRGGVVDCFYLGKVRLQRHIIVSQYCLRCT